MGEEGGGRGKVGRAGRGVGGLEKGEECAMDRAGRGERRVLVDSYERGGSLLAYMCRERGGCLLTYVS